jgi:competence protein ComEA
MKAPMQAVPPLARIARQLVGFSRREVRGFAALLTVLAVLVVLPTLVGRWLTASAPPRSVAADDIRTLDHLAAKLELSEQAQRRARYPERNSTAYGASASSRFERSSREEAPVALLKTLTPFDPNALTAHDWQQRGVPAAVARRIVSYGQKAGGYRYREQLARIHGLDPALLARLTPFMQLPDREQAFSRRSTNAPAGMSAAGASAFASASPNAATPTAFARKARVMRAFDLNTADTTTLMQMRGIGQRRAARIVELREKLGGFVSPTQLADVWGLDPALIDTLGKYGHVEAGFHPRPLAINSATLEELRTHPYVGYRLARVIVAYRDQHGPFAKVEDLRQIRILDDATYQKLLPYVALR